MSNLTWGACSVCAARVARLVEKGRGFGRHSSCEESSDYLPWRRANSIGADGLGTLGFDPLRRLLTVEFGWENDLVVLRSTRFIRIVRRRTHAESLNLGCHSGEPPYCVGVFSLHKDGNVGDAMAGLSIRLSCLSNDVTMTRTGRLLISGG